ncbi:hypothetical protein D9757_005187 [Collybiopsis confluens]|uniref:Uncharacterized protein n=1 Tax=Collybiopsis confluens TaxID=2823264 RepID=A0A8H5HW30_9AGAR|nr:hypothetical protein D9757_005187 [Collybiopsis confluens]
MITEGSATKQLLPKELRVSFLRKQVVCLEHIGLTSEDERELFNVSLAFPKHSWSLSRGFIRGKFWDLPSNLVSQPARLVHFVRELLDAYVVLDSTLRTMPWDRREGLDFCIFSHTVRYTEMWPSQESLEIKSLEGWLEGNVEIAVEIGSRVRNTLDLFKQISSNLEYNRPFFTYKMVSLAGFAGFSFRHTLTFENRFSRFEMIFISPLIFVCGVLPSPELKLSPGDISKQISELRTFIHDEFGECDSLDDRTGTTLFDFIKRRERVKEVSLEQSD